jgi:hypothetical protein
MLFNSEKLKTNLPLLIATESEIIMKTLKSMVLATIATLVNTNTKNINVDNVVNDVFDRFSIDMNTAKIITGLSMYHITSATDNYYIVAENTEVVKTKCYHFFDLLDFDCFNITTSSTNETSIRLKVSNELKKDILENGMLLSNIDRKNEYKKMFNYNNGQVSEWLVKDKFNVNYQRDNLPYYRFGDMEICYNTYQIKSHKATFCTLSQLQRYINRYGLKKYYSYDMTVSNKNEVVDIDFICDKIFDIDPFAKIGSREERWLICANDDIKTKLLEMIDDMCRNDNSVTYWNLTEIAHNNNLRPLYLMSILFDIMD